MKKVTKTTLCAGFTEEKDIWREDRKRERKLRGGAGSDRGTVKELQRRQRKKRGIQVSVVDYACWAGIFIHVFWKRKKC